MLVFCVYSVITVGGDGMFHEILNGLIRRTQTDYNIDTTKLDFEPVHPNLTIGVIPAGKVYISSLFALLLYIY
jgi:ceramide kinase